MFDLYSGGSHNSTTLVLLNGSTDRTGAIDMGLSGIALGSNHPLFVHLEYDVTQLTLSETVFDTVSGAVFQHVFTDLDIPQIVGGTTAYVGFTGGTGGETSIQNIVSWSGRFLDPDQSVGHDSTATASITGITAVAVAVPTPDRVAVAIPDVAATTFDGTSVAARGNTDTNSGGTVTWMAPNDDAGVVLPADDSFPRADGGAARIAAFLETGGEMMRVADPFDTTLTGSVSGE
jgi:hypothetical protein